MRHRARAAAKRARFTIESDGQAGAVRVILTDLRGRLAELGLCAELSGKVELALAEALNNIIEHAYPPEAAATLQLHGEMTRDWLKIELRDSGRPLPGLGVPPAVLPDASGPVGTLPEGGFGWFLIHDLTDLLSYERCGNGNRLQLGFRINQLAP